MINNQNVINNQNMQIMMHNKKWKNANFQIQNQNNNNVNNLGTFH